MDSRKMRSFFLTSAAFCFILKSSLASSQFGTTHTQRGRYNAFDKELKVAGESWPPYWIIYCPDGTEKQFLQDCATIGDMSYGGVMWELLLLMQRAKNVTFTHMIPPDLSWGNCYSKNNCTGMIGMVNRGEVDFAIGFDRYIYSNVKYQFDIMI